MNDPEQKPAETAATAAVDPARQPPPARMPRPVLAALCLAAAATLFGATHWLLDRGADDDLRRELARRLAEMDVQNREAGARAAQAANALREAEVKLGVLEAKLAESQSQQIALEALYQELSRNRDEWAFADIEQSVLLASQQLQVAANVRAALIGLENAEARLQRLDQPRYAALKRALARDIEKLKALPLTDLYGNSARIDDLIAAVERLPLAMAARARPDVPPPASGPEAPGWARVLREIWGEMRQLVRIQTSGVQDATLLAPDQAFFLRENLKLRLSSARLALLTRDTRAYQGDLRTVMGALDTHFERNDAAVIAAVAMLRKLQAAQLQAELPDLAETMEALRKLRLPRPRPAG